MSDTAVAINIVVLLALIIFSIQRLGEHGNQNSSKTIEPSQPPISKEELNTRGLPYDKEDWRVVLPQSVVEQLEVCFDGDKNKVYAMKRAFELSLEHYTYEMEDDKECARIIDERDFDGKKEQISFEEMLQNIERNKTNEKTKENLQ